MYFEQSLHAFRRSQSANPRVCNSVMHFALLKTLGSHNRLFAGESRSQNFQGSTSQNSSPSKSQIEDVASPLCDSKCRSAVRPPSNHQSRNIPMSMVMRLLLAQGLCLANPASQNFTIKFLRPAHISNTISNHCNRGNPSGWRSASPRRGWHAHV